MAIEYQLHAATPAAWLEAVMADFDTFLLDHAANERKASAMAMSMVAHYPDRTQMVEKLIELAIEELNHYKQVVKLVFGRGLELGADIKDPYVNQLRHHVRRPSEAFLLDRLLLGSIIEARGAERFALVAETVEEKGLSNFYRSLASSEERHHLLFIQLAELYFPPGEIRLRLTEWLEIEAQVMSRLPITARLH